MRNYKNIDENSRIILDLQYKMFFYTFNESMCGCDCEPKNKSFAFTNYPNSNDFYFEISTLHTHMANGKTFHSLIYLVPKR